MRFLVSLTVALCLFSLPLVADTNVSGTISANTTWTAAASPYVVTASVTVASGVTLTVEPGVLVKFNTYTKLLVLGTLTAVGTSASPITFTSSAVSPTRGSWGEIEINGGTNPASQISYATISYGGSPGEEVYLSSGSATFDHVTITESSQVGIWSSTASPVTMNTITVSNCTGDGMYMLKYYVQIGLHTISGSSFTGNGGYGVNLDLNGHVSITNTSFTNNTNYAMAAIPSVAIDGLSNITASGNGSGTKNALQYRGGTISDRDETWRASSLPYVLTAAVTVASGRVLTVEAGSIIKSVNYLRLLIQGTLTAVGTTTNPITFTSSAVSPTRGSWGEIEIDSGTNPASQISYATISYGGSTGEEVYLASGSATLDHVTITESSTVGIWSSTGNPVTMNSVTISNCTSHGIHMEKYYVPTGLHTITDSTFANNGGYGADFAFNATAALHHTAFSGNASGGVRSTTNVIVATFCYWSNATGPSGSGFGSGQSVSTNVLFEPWLAAAPTVTQRFTTHTIRNRAFNPSISTAAHVTVETNNSGAWTLNVINSANTTIRTFTGTGASADVSWDGKDASGVTQVNGNYTYEFQSTNGTDAAAPLRGRSIVDSTKQLTLTGYAGTPSYFSPNADSVQDTTTIAGTPSFQDTSWTITIKDSSANVVRTVTGSDLISYVWDGRNASNSIQPDGPYTADIIVTIGTASTTGSASLILDAIFPVATIDAPGATETISNVYGSSDSSVRGTISDTNLQNWTLDYSTAPPNWTVLTTGTTPVAGAQLILWQTINYANGIYNLRLRAWDQAGNVTTTTLTPTVANFKMTQGAFQFNTTSQTVTYTSIVPFTLTETLTIKNEAGAVVRTLVNSQRAAGTYSDAWNGRNDATVIVPDGGYSYTATVTDGTHTFIWDKSGVMRASSPDEHAMYPSLPATFDPFNNRPVRVTYNLSDATRTAVEVGLAADAYGADCASLFQTYGTVCLTQWKYESSGTHSYSWWGTNTNGSFLRNKPGLNVIYRNDTFPQSVVVAYGSAPTIANESVTPALFNPGAATPALNSPSAGTQAITFTLSTYQSQPANVTVRVVNQSSVSTLRTINVPSQAPGAVTVTWDGRADNGMWVAPGAYTLIVTASDTAGNVTTQHLVTQIEY